MSYDLFGGALLEPPSVYVPPPVITPPPSTTPAPSEPQPLGFYINTVEQLPSGTMPYVEIDESSTVGNIKFNFGLEQGLTGPKGEKGDDGTFGVEEELRLLAVETGLGAVQTEIEGIGTAITNITADVALLTTGLSTVSGEVDELIAQVNTDLEPRVIALEEKTTAITYDVLTTNIASNLITGDIICDKIYTTVFTGQASWGTIYQLG